MCITLFVVIVTYTINITNKTDEDGVFSYPEVYLKYNETPTSVKSSGSETIKVLYNKEVLLFIIKLQAKGDDAKVEGKFTIAFQKETLTFEFSYKEGQSPTFKVPSSKIFKFTPTHPVPHVTGSDASVSFGIEKQ